MSVTAAASPPISDQTRVTEDSTEERLEKFRHQYCQSIDKETMDAMITSGEDILKQLLKAAQQTPEGASATTTEKTPFQEILEKREITNKAAAICILWAITKKVAELNELFTSGSIRIGRESGLSSDQLEQFFKACGRRSDDPGAPTYSRISTHMKEGTWNAGGARKVFKNICEFFAHAFDFISTRFSSSEKSKTLRARKEHVPDKLKKAYTKIMSILCTDTKTRKQAIKEGKKKGISEMQKHLPPRTESNGKNVKRKKR